MNSKSKKITILAMLTALSMMLSYIESLFVFTTAVPGVKIGLANIAIIFILYKFSFKEALIVNIIRILLTGFLFTNFFSIIYSMTGAIVSLVIMWSIKKSNKFSIYGCSVLGAVSHNVSQIIVAFIIVKSSKIFYYLPVLIGVACISGVVVGLISALILKRLEKVKIND